LFFAFFKQITIKFCSLTFVDEKITASRDIADLKGKKQDLTPKSI